MKYLHPILYQHSLGEIPNNVKVKFAEGVTFEYEEGSRFVDWCAFGADSNERQRSMYNQDLAKLLALRKTFEAKGKVDVRSKEWRAIKVESKELRVAAPPTLHGPGLGELRIAAPLAQHGRPPLRVKEEQEPAMTKSYLGEIGDCDGNFKSGMESGN